MRQHTHGWALRGQASHIPGCSVEDKISDISATTVALSFFDRQERNVCVGNSSSRKFKLRSCPYRDREAPEHATVGPVIVGSRQVTMAGAPARSHGLRAGALSSRYISSANTRRGLTKCNVKRNLSDRIVRASSGDANQCKAR
jgi:hypothetical protein